MFLKLDSKFQKRQCLSFFSNSRNRSSTVTPYPFARLTLYIYLPLFPIDRRIRARQPSTSLASNSSNLDEERTSEQEKERERESFSDFLIRERRFAAEEKGPGKYRVSQRITVSSSTVSFLSTLPRSRGGESFLSLPPPSSFSPPQFRPRNYPAVFNFRDEPRP